MRRLSLLGLLILFTAVSTYVITELIPQGGRGGGGAELVPCGLSPTVPSTITPAATIHEVTPVFTLAPFKTPTPIVPGPMSFLEAWFTPQFQMKVRAQPALTATVLRYLPAGVRVAVYKEVFPPEGGAWLYVAPSGYVAYRLGSVTYGDLQIVQP